MAVDGGRLKLEWGVLNSRSGECVEDLLWREDDRVTGFAGIYAFGGDTVELAGMVDPAARRRGIGTALLAAALPLCRDRGYQQALLVTPRRSAAGRRSRSRAVPSSNTPNMRSCCVRPLPTVRATRTPRCGARRSRTRPRWPRDWLPHLEGRRRTWPTARLDDRTDPLVERDGQAIGTCG